jgi:hypothetical protein
MIGFIRKLLKDRRGNALAIAAACMPLVIGAAGLATDTIQWTLWKRQLQRAADSAAIAGVYDRQAANGATTTVSATVSHDLTLNNHVWMALKSGYPQVSFPGNSGAMTNQVKVTLAVQQRLPFSSFFMSSPPTIIANATAAAVPAGGSACFEALETGTATGLNFTGNAGIEAPDCDGFSNASGSNTSVAKGSSDITLNSIGGVGGIQQSNNFHVGSYRPYSPALADPFATVNPDPSLMKCATTTVVQGGKNITSLIGLNENTDLSSLDPGTNCFSSLSVSSNKTLNLPSGTYYINGGDANIQGNLSCTSCTIVLTNLDTAPTATIGNIKVNASSNINMTAPTSGTFKGIAIFQDRRATDCNQCNKINGNSGSIIQGAIYFPKQELEYNGTGTTSAICTMFVARRLNFSGNSTTTNKFSKLDDCAAYGLGGAPTVSMVRLVG